MTVSSFVFDEEKTFSDAGMASGFEDEKLQW